MMRVESETVIGQPSDTVFSFATNVNNQILWVPAVAEVRATSEDSIDVGTNFVQVVQFLGRRFEANFQVTKYEENRLMSFQSTSGPIEMEIIETFQPVGEQTRAHLVLQGEPHGFFGIARPLLQNLVQRQLDSAVANLKDVLESRSN